jgi:integrase
MADYCLAMMRALFNRHAVGSDDYTSPIIRGMALTSTKERARKRVLDRIEIKALWRACAKADIFGHFIRFAMLTATRRGETAGLRRTEIEGRDWTIPASRYKTNVDHVIPMSTAAVAVLAVIPRIGKGDLVFTVDGCKPLSGFGCRKEAFDKLMMEELRAIAAENGEDDLDAVKMMRWTLHDLRRTARTLLSRAKVPAEHAEACLGHVKRGVEGTYDRYEYHDEKADAFGKLADLISDIVGEHAGLAIAA